MGIVSLIASALFGHAIFMAGPGSFTPDVQRILIDAGYGIYLLGLLVIASLGTLLTGYAFLRSYTWARPLGYTFAVLGLLDFPLGTALGVYTIWVLGQSKVPDDLTPATRQN